MSEVQKHGIVWERVILTEVYNLALEQRFNYTSKYDLPGEFNNLDPGVNVSIKTSCKPDVICMADCLRVFDSVSSGDKVHLITIVYKQRDSETKFLEDIIQVDLTNSKQELFGDLVREQIQELDSLVKTIPSKRRPTPEERIKMYALKSQLDNQTGAVQLNIKCNSQQSRLQCSITKFRDFLTKFPERVLHRMVENTFRNQVIVNTVIKSSRRVFKK